ncbi:hypothetical protein K1T71_012462 [Dendrolimus kikuchii]|uniref:Uncharacterized protein n=1 Tax=Dendrolimus kikuchii TaxID=765133 RepID=A0ACC1CJS4_9NEOP|nr:hypothetical protein K1T71_012462 [Dendrolimus kikuchii]
MFRPRIIFDFGIEKHSLVANQLFNSILLEKWPDWLPMFTDASKLSPNGPTGAAVWIPKYKIILNYKLPSYSSVFTGEAIAILEATLYIESHRIRKSIVFTDSLSCLQDIAKSPFRSKDIFTISLQIKDTLQRCHDMGLEVVLAWIPGHSGISGNETADNCCPLRL